MSHLARIFFIDTEIREKGIVTTKEVIKEFEVTDRQVRNDIQYLKDSLEAPIIYSKKKGGYIYENTYSLLSFADEKLLLSYSFFKSIINTKDFIYIPHVSEEITKSLSKNLSLPYKELSDKIVYELSNYDNLDINTFNIIIKSFLKKKKCKITYVNLKNEESERTIEPLTLINYSGSWHLVSYCYSAGSIRTFKLTRVKDIELTDQKFEQTIRKNTIDNYIQKGYGIFLTTPGHDVLIDISIRFYSRGFMVMKDQKFHKDQIEEIGTDEKKGEYIQFTFPVTAYDEVLTKVLKFGPDAEVISPKDFREYWLDNIKKMYELYVK